MVRCLKFGAYPMSERQITTGAAFSTKNQHPSVPLKRTLSGRLLPPTPSSVGTLTASAGRHRLEGEIRLAIGRARQSFARRIDGARGEIYDLAPGKPWKVRIFGRLSACKTGFFIRQTRWGDKGRLEGLRHKGEIGRLQFRRV